MTMIDEIAAFEGRVAKVCGPVRSGKTEALVRRAAALVAAGAAPEEVLLCTSTAEGARQARGRVVAALAAAGVADSAAVADRMAVAPVRAVCLAALDAPEARAFTGRVPRVLAPFEYNFFLEDMKTLGQPLRRLRGVLRKFQYQWSALAPEADWVVPGDEQDALEHAHRLLAFEGAMLEAEVPFLCAQYLQSDAGAAARGRYRAVLADDFQNLSAAQQTCLCLLARDQLIVAGNPNEAVAVAAAFPHPSGFADFDALRHGVTRFDLDTAWGNPNITAFCDALAGAEGMDGAVVAARREGAAADIATVKWRTPDDEFNGLTRHLLERHRESPDAPEGATCLVAPNKQWAHAFRQMLERRGFTVSPLGFDGVGGDPRDEKRARAMMAYTVLSLLADPEDVAAWRAWLGYGNYLTYSDGWNALMNWCDDHGAGMFEALEAARAAEEAGEAEPFPRSAALARRYRAGRELVAAHRGRTGYGLLSAVGADGIDAFDAVRAAMAGDEDAPALFALVRDRQFAPVHRADPHAVRISSYEQMAGCSYEDVYLVGCVDGFMPARDAFEVVSTDDDRARVREEGRRAFMAAAGKGAARLMFSTFSLADLELAERTKMQVRRVRMEGDRRMATLHPTCFIEEAGAAAPITLGGQALLANPETR